LNDIITRACHPDCGQRYAAAAELQAALQKAHKTLETNAAM